MRLITTIFSVPFSIFWLLCGALLTPDCARAQGNQPQSGSAVTLSISPADRSIHPIRNGFTAQPSERIGAPAHAKPWIRSKAANADPTPAISSLGFYPMDVV